MNLLELIKEGGWIMIPLLICSVLIWAVVIEKWINLRNFKKNYLKLFKEAEALIKEKKMDELKGILKSNSWSISAPFLALIEGMDEARINRRLQETYSDLKKFLWILGTISSAAPFIGLFGTVVGIIKSFDSMALSGKSGFSVVASGLSEALIATAAGILVAVIAVLFYNYFQVKINILNADYKNKLADLADELDF